MLRVIIVGVILVVAIILSLVWAFSGSSDNVAKETEKINICQRLNETLDPDYLVSNYFDRFEVNQRTADVSLQIGSKTLGAHKILLAAYSNQLEFLLAANKTTFPENETIAFKSFLRFIYNNEKLPANLTDRLDLLTFADSYGIPQLKCKLEEAIHKQIDLKNIFEVYHSASVANAVFLKIAASHFIADNSDQVIKQQKWTHSMEFVDALDTWKKHGNESTKCQIACPSNGLQSDSIVDRLKRFFIVERYADATLHLSEHEIQVNRAVLVTQSPAWQRAFSRTDSPNDVELPPFTDYYSMKQFISYMYSGWVPGLKENTENLLALASEYEMHPLRNACEEIILNKLTIDTAANLLILANRVDSIRIKNQTTEYFFSHRNEIVKTDGWKELKKNHPNVLANVLVRL